MIQWRIQSNEGVIWNEASRFPLWILQIFFDYREQNRRNNSPSAQVDIETRKKNQYHSPKFRVS